MINGLVLESFKAFNQRQYIPFAPITLIYGTNSAGKSSIIQALLLLKQSVESKELFSTLVTRGDLVDLGNFHDISFNHDRDRIVEVSPILQRRSPSSPRSSRDIPYEFSNALGIGVRFGYDPQTRALTICELPVYSDTTQSTIFSVLPSSSRTGVDADELLTPQARVAQIQQDHPAWAGLYNRFRRIPLQQLQASLNELAKLLAIRPDKRVSLRDTANSLALHRWLTSPDGEENLSERAPLREKAVHDLIQRLETYSKQQFIEDTALLAQERPLRLLGFLPLPGSYSTMNLQYREPGNDPAAMRTQLLRAVRRPGQNNWFPDLSNISATIANDLEVQLKGAVYIGPLRQLPERLYTVSGTVERDVGKSGERTPDVLFRQQGLVRETNRMLQIFGVPYEIAIRGLEDPDVEDVFRLTLLDKWTKTVVSMLDVGFGISQVLPIIVQSMLSRDRIIVVEQPEIHVHPRLQAELGSLFAHSVGEEFGNQFVIETHSEHLMRRIQRLVREGQLSHNDLSVLYVTRDQDGSAVHSLKMDETGDFVDEWPEGFFEEAYRETFASR